MIENSWKPATRRYAGGWTCALAALGPLTAFAIVDRPDASPMTPTTVALTAVADARTQAGSPDVNFADGHLWVGTPRGHASWVRFDLSSIPAGAVIDSARVRMTFTHQNAGIKDVELGAVLGPWDEELVTWANQPGVKWSGKTRTVPDCGGGVGWNVTAAVRAWMDGSHDNNGFAFRGIEAGTLKAAHSRETGGMDEMPTLLIAYH